MEENAFTRRVAKLQAQWAEFTQRRESRLLHWIADEDERLTIDAFFAYDDASGATGDLFFRPNVPFQSPDHYTRDLIRWLADEYEELRPELEKEGLAAEWRVEVSTDIRDLASALSSFCDAYGSIFKHLGLVVSPAQGGNSSAFARWLESALLGFQDHRVRLLAFDRRDQPLLAGLAERRADMVNTIEANLDLPAAYLEISEAAGLDTPDAEFRHRYISMLNALKQGDDAALQQHGRAATRLAREHDWPELEGAAWAVLGAGATRREDFLAALSAYRNMDECGERDHVRGGEAGQMLQFQARLSIGVTCLTAQQFHLAARAFTEAAGLAEELGNCVLHVDAWRLTSFAWEQARRFTEAWDAGIQGLVVADEMSAEERRESTLVFLGESLLRVAKQRRFRSRRGWVHQQMAQLVGPDWQQQAETMANEPEAAA